MGAVLLPAAADADPGAEEAPGPPRGAEDPSQRLRETLRILEAQPDSAAKGSLLLDLVESCRTTDCTIDPDPLLGQATGLIATEKDAGRQVRQWIRLARLQLQLGNREQALDALNRARGTAQALPEGPENTSRRSKGQLLLAVGLAWEGLGEGSEAGRLIAAANTLLEAPEAERFPFVAQPLNLELGFGAGGNSFTDTTAQVDLSVDLYKQWPRQDIYLNGVSSLNYDSTRTNGTYRPTGLSTLIYRYHLNPKWSLIYDQLTVLNSSAFESDDDDGDLSFSSFHYVGVGMNLWRGSSPAEFLDLQFGFGPRISYEFLDFKQRRNEVQPAITLIMVGRDIQLGKARLAQLLGVSTATTEWDDISLLSDTSLIVPLGRRWSWKNNFVVRYRNKPIVDYNPSINFLFSTGFSFRFSP
jgi:hypothetical protein